MKLVYKDNKCDQTPSRMIVCCAVFASFIPITAYPDHNELETSIMQEISLEGLYELPIIDIATGTAVPKEKAPAVTSLITANDIKAMGALTIDEVLEAVPGLHVVPSTLSRLNPVYSFRGLYTGFNPQVLFMLNGHRIVGDLYSGGFSFLGRLNIENISRIEVVRGPGSAIYGADAFAGVINIITKSAQELDGFHAGIRGGSNNTQNFWAQYGGDLGNQWQMALNLELFKQDSDTSRMISSDAQTTFDNLFGSSASLAPGYLEDRFESTTYNIHINNPNWKIGLDGVIKRDNGIGAGAAQALDYQGFDDYDQYLFSLGYQNKDWLTDWDFESKFSYYYSESKPVFNLFPAGTVLPVGNDGNIFTPHNGVGCLTANIPEIGCVTTFTDGYLGNPHTKNTMPEIQATALFEGLKNHQMRFNLGLRKEKFEASSATQNFGPGVLDSETLNGSPNPVLVDGSLTDVTGTAYTFSPDVDRTVKYLSLQDEWNFNIDWTLTLGVRYDDYSDFGSTTNPRAALVWTPTARLTTKILYGEAFRAPSFSELYSQNNPVVLGNENLDPETIKTTELAFNYEITPDLMTDLNVYHYKTKDMVEFVANADGSKTAQNNKSLTGKGVEIEANWIINNKWKLLANYAFQSTEDDKTNQQVEYVPKQQLYLDARYQFLPEWELSSQLNWVGDRERAIGDTREDIKDYALVNLTLRRSRFSFGDGAKNWEFAASIKNLLDENAYEPSDGSIADDYPLNERRFYAEIRYHLAN
ncbi:MAG: TonB-dependent receptor [gamma proteobacterium symbiont of Taylorina sp.]|nr:TonB-dependent receptor [gamma proteobacterium symbiont of Taylorina sp.]